MTLMMRDRENIEKRIEQRDRMLIFKWSVDGRTISEIAGLLDIPEEQVRRVQSEDASETP